MSPHGTPVGLTSLLTLAAIPLVSCTPGLGHHPTSSQELVPQIITKTIVTTITTSVPVPTAISNSTYSNHPVTTDEVDDNIRNGTLHIVDDDPVYKYAGCWTDTTELPGQPHALDGPNLNLARAMTVPKCIKYCETAKNPAKGPGGVGWPVAAIEFSRECYCGSAISKHSFHLHDNVCDTPCAGSNATACGGNLALSVYNVTQKDDGSDDDGGNGDGGNAGDSTGSGNENGQDGAPEGEAVIQAVGLGVLVLALTLAVGVGLF
ncbi:Mitochondrial intermediate peptidase [Hypoxylon texense]